MLMYKKILFACLLVAVSVIALASLAQVKPTTAPANKKTAIIKPNNSPVPVVKATVKSVAIKKPALKVKVAPQNKPIVKGVKIAPAVKTSVVNKSARSAGKTPAKATVKTPTKVLPKPAIKPAVKGVKIEAGQKLTADQAKEAATAFIRQSLLDDNTSFDIQSVKANHGLYELSISISGGSPIQSAISEDGATFFPSRMDIVTVSQQRAAAKAQAAVDQAKKLATVVKNDKPAVELFVMSHCPFGTQIEKGIIPVVEALGNKIDFQVKFVDYSMHGAKEIAEQLNQYCVNKTQPDKYLAYLKCFLTDGNSDRCIKAGALNTALIDSCVKDTDAQYNITKVAAGDQSSWGSAYPPFPIFKADNTKYGVSGSPTLVINGAEVSTNRDANSLLTTICNHFNNKPAECGQALSSVTPSTGFGWSSSGSTGNATCNPS